MPRKGSILTQGIASVLKLPHLNLPDLQIVQCAKDFVLLPISTSRNVWQPGKKLGCMSHTTTINLHKTQEKTKNSNAQLDIFALWLHLRNC